MANRERSAGQRPLEINPNGCLHRRVKIVGEALACVRCGAELHGVEYVAEMWATLWDIWQHCDPPPTEGTMLDYYVDQLAKMQDAAGIAGKGARPILGPARVIDGDTLDLAGVRIRLHGIEAPEGRQTCEREGVTWLCGQEAAKALRGLVGGQAAEVRAGSPSSPSCRPSTGPAGDAGGAFSLAAALYVPPMLDPRRFRITKIVLMAVLLTTVLAFVAVLILGGAGL